MRLVRVAPHGFAARGGLGNAIRTVAPGVKRAVALGRGEWKVGRGLEGYRK